MRGRSLGIKTILALKSVAKDLGCHTPILANAIGPPK